METVPSIVTGLDRLDQKTGIPEKPKTLGSGFVTSVLGEGGAAIVYEIWNPKLEIHRAVKLWRPNVSEKDLQRFETEIKITSKLDHPNIVEIHTVGEWNGLPYIEMERIDGFSLQQLLKNNGALPPAVALAIMIFICRALHYAHQEEFSLYGKKRKGVIHCDIKPANIMITRSGVVKLMDFGIANPTNVSLHTDPYKVTGSLQYMAPEQIRSQQVDARADIYSIGVVLYEILSGTRAFPSKQLLDIIEKRKTNDYVHLSQFCVNLPKRIHKIVTACMELQPEDRYQNIPELMKTLSGIFRRYSHEDPQLIIQQYINRGTVSIQKIRISRHILIPVVAAVIPTLLLSATLLFLIVSSRGKENRLTSVQTATSALKTDKPPARVETETKITDPFVATVEPVVKEAEKSKAPGRVDAVSPAEMAGREEKPDVNTEVSHPKARHAVPDPDPLTILESLVEGGNLSAALRRFAAQKIEDGAYYALYARCYYESGEWEKAYETAEISTRVPSRRISPNSRKGQFLLYKAKWFSVRFDRSPTHEGAQEAIAAWWDVRQHFDGTAESAKASFAESEIGRLSSVFSE